LIHRPDIAQSLLLFEGSMISDPQNNIDPSQHNPLVEDPDDLESAMPTVINPPIVPVEDGDDMPTIVLPMQLAGLEEAAATDVGQQREHNEDFFGITVALHKQEFPLGTTVQAKGLYILCDGMGGHAGGEVASRMAVESVQSYLKTHWYEQPTTTLPTAEVIHAAIGEANRVIYDENQQGSRLGSGRMGTTLVMLLVCGTSIAFANVGDSRLYRFTRKQGLVQLTTDHEVGQREMQRGVPYEVAYGRQDAYQLTQALGPRDQAYIEPDVQFMDLAEDALFLLASDGLTDGNLLEQYWPSYVEPLISSHGNLEQGVQQLIMLGNQVNGHDNITAIVVRAKVRPDLSKVRP
jgi:protein phosphatase